MSRKLAREVVFRALFQLDFNFDDERRAYFEDLAIDMAIETAPEDGANQGARLTKKNLAYIESTLKGTRTHLDEIDELITAHLKEGWQLSRIMAEDRNILRLAIYEMKFVEPALSKKIVINEAVELAKSYGNDDSSRFVNGVLEAISD